MGLIIYTKVLLELCVCSFNLTDGLGRGEEEEKGGGGEGGKKKKRKRKKKIKEGRRKRRDIKGREGRS